MARDALRRADAPVRPALSLLPLLTLLLALAACDDRGPSADPLTLPDAAPAAGEGDWGTLPVLDGPTVPLVEITLASADDVAAFNAGAHPRLAGVLRLTGELPAEVILPHVAQAGLVVVDAPALTRLVLPALTQATALQIRGDLATLDLPRLASLGTLDLTGAPALTGLTLPALATVDTFSAVAVPGARWRLPRLAWIGTLSWTGGGVGAPHWLALEGWLSGGEVWVDTAGAVRLDAPALDRLQGLSVRAPEGSQVQAPTLREISGAVRWALAGPPPQALAAVDGDLHVVAGATRWPALQGVGGDLTVEGAAVTGVFLPVLLSVGGRVRVQAAGLAELAWPRLRWVGDGLQGEAAPGVEIAHCPALRLAVLDDLARAHAGEGGVAVWVHGNGALCTAPRFGAVPAEQVRYEAACRR